MSQFTFETHVLLVGRSTPHERVDVDLNPDAMVSRKHCTLQMQQSLTTGKNQIWIYDHGNKSGSYVNGERLADAMKAGRRDVISIGQTELRVQIVQV